MKNKTDNSKSGRYKGSLNVERKRKASKESARLRSKRERINSRDSNEDSVDMSAARGNIKAITVSANFS